ncbi:glycine/sarcosine/betaine reductase complex component C subunit beta [Brevibacillus massiliensis]|jgi:betaine reductase|uniref:glycine/sarcosine/betaine reductase complex component C subunit beta n=1 Tax=Brevibacillus massiliensis TaxID=1118054 RepID=UPI00031A18B3|nr:glycine/sarcosine/betaine reductase complex component C subunit beta [Brevibacillus massiliensis]
MVTPVVKGASFVLVHTPELVCHGSKPAREIKKDKDLLANIARHLRSYQEAVAYPPNQAFIGNLRPDRLREVEQPWHRSPLQAAERFSSSGEIMPQEEFYGWLKLADEYDLVQFEESFLAEIKPKLEQHPLIAPNDLEKLGSGVQLAAIEEKIAQNIAIPLYNGGKLAGCVSTAHEEDENLTAEIILENLCNKASGVVAMRYVLRSFDVTAEQIQYVIGCDEEAVGDRYQRGGGNMAKSIAELAGCVNASGSDIKSFCCAPAHAVVVAACLVQAGLYEEVLVIGGGCLAKLGMKYAGHLKHDMPILEDQMGAIAILIGKDDGKSPVIRLDAVGKHDISSGSSAQAIYQSLVVAPLTKIGKKILDIDKFAVELHNPEVTEPNGNGNVPRTNYRTIASMAVLNGEMDRTRIAEYEVAHGMPGFSPTQGHIAAAIPFMGHAREMIMNGEIENAMFVAKGSLFLGKMTKLSDGMSYLIERNKGVS